MSEFLCVKVDVRSVVNLLLIFLLMVIMMNIIRL